jgi:hypothetical protein
MADQEAEPMDLQCGNSICGSSLRSITPLGALRAATSPSLPLPKWRRVALLRNGRQASAGRLCLPPDTLRPRSTMHVLVLRRVAGARRNRVICPGYKWSKQTIARYELVSRRWPRQGDFRLVFAASVLFSLAAFRRATPREIDSGQSLTSRGGGAKRRLTQ